jgi:hypothetical protein
MGMRSPAIVTGVFVLVMGGASIAFAVDGSRSRATAPAAGSSTSTDGPALDAFKQSLRDQAIAATASASPAAKDPLYTPPPPCSDPIGADSRTFLSLRGSDIAWPQSPVAFESGYFTSVNHDNYAVLVGGRWTLDSAGDLVEGPGAISVVINRGRGLQRCPTAGTRHPRGTPTRSRRVSVRCTLFLPRARRCA